MGFAELGFFGILGLFVLLLVIPSIVMQRKGRKVQDEAVQIQRAAVQRSLELSEAILKANQDTAAAIRELVAELRQQRGGS